MVRELRSENERIQGELAGVPTEKQKALSRKLVEMIENARRESHLQLPDKEVGSWIGGGAHTWCSLVAAGPLATDGKKLLGSKKQKPM
jgi:hypothetical protein